jgi:hypothetical protein
MSADFLMQRITAVENCEYAGACDALADVGLEKSTLNEAS